MAGVVGDVVKPVSVTSKIRHFVTPRKTGQLNQEYVILKAENINAEDITENNPKQIFVWDGGEEVPGKPLQRRVKRDAAGRTIVRIKAKQGGMVAAEMQVWVVWCEVTATPGNAVFNPVSGGAVYEVKDDLNGNPPETGWRFIFKIQPPAIVEMANLDRPYLDRAAPTPLPVPGAGKPYTIKPSLGAGDSAQWRWDVSRQYQLQIRNPGNISK